MKPEIKRREFITKSYHACMAGCILMMGPKITMLAGIYQQDDKVPDPKKLNYCGYQCPADCKFLQATLENNTELKKEAYDLWKIKERYNVEFVSEKIFCYGCKPAGKPEGVVLSNCTVRSCAMSKKIDCCIECMELSVCKKDLWERFPKFREMVIEMQKKYLNSKEKV